MCPWLPQGPVLEKKNLTVGIVEGISGVFSLAVTLTGEANHAGTVRRDGAEPQGPRVGRHPP